MRRQDTDALILQVVTAIPAGSVASYGQIARLAGLGRAARRVAAALRRADAAQAIPWHRVLRSDGHLGLPAGSTAWNEQLQRLLAEGVAVKGGRVDMRQFQWSGANSQAAGAVDGSSGTSLDAMLWRLDE